MNALRHLRFLRRTPDLSEVASRFGRFDVVLAAGRVTPPRAVPQAIRHPPYAAASTTEPRYPKATAMRDVCVLHSWLA